MIYNITTAHHSTCAVLSSCSRTVLIFPNYCADLCCLPPPCIQEDENDQDLLLDGAVPPVTQRQGSLIELPLSYNLTGHTGSFMYMAPEVFKVSNRIRNLQQRERLTI